MNHTASVFSPRYWFRLPMRRVPLASFFLAIYLSIAALLTAALMISGAISSGFLVFAGATEAAPAKTKEPFLMAFL